MTFGGSAIGVFCRRSPANRKDFSVVFVVVVLGSPGWLSARRLVPIVLQK